MKFILTVTIKDSTPSYVVDAIRNALTNLGDKIGTSDDIHVTIEEG